MEKPFQHIESNPEVLNGKPVLKGTRISVQLVLEWLASGATVDQIVTKHPLITKAAVLEAVRYGNNANSLLDLAGTANGIYGDIDDYIEKERDWD